MAHCQPILDELQAACDLKAIKLVAALQCEAEHNGGSSASTGSPLIIDLYLEACPSLDDKERMQLHADVQWYLATEGPRVLPKHMKE